MHEEGQRDRQEEEPEQRLKRRAVVAWLGLALVSSTLVFVAAPASALITPPVTVDGPSSDILDFGGVAMASDGSGGLVYLKAVEGVPHVFASRFAGGGWGEPVRVDWDVAFAASQPRIGAGPHGELLVVWVAPIATVKSKIRYALYSASIGRNAAGFGPSELVDPNVGEGDGVDPSVFSTAPGKAIVAYRTITFKFDQPAFTTAVQLRPGDVMAEIRVARLSGDRWAQVGPVNRNPEASMRPASATNGPQVAAGADGGAAVAWQEPDQTGTARVWMRRIFGNTPGPVLEGSPATWQGKPVTADADAFALAVSPLDQVRLATRVAAGSPSPLSGRLLLSSLPANYSTAAGKVIGPELADGGAAQIGPPGVAANDEGGGEGSMRLGFLAGSQLRQMAVDSNGALTGVTLPPGAPAQPGATTVTAVDPEGGGLAAYPALDPEGHSVVAVRQEFPSGSAQTGLISGLQGGPISGLAIGRSDSGDGLLAFRQGEVGYSEIVAERVSAPPAKFNLRAGTKWEKPGRAELNWERAPSAVGGIRYSVLLNGRIIKQRLRKRHYRLPAAVFGNGVRQVRVLATDALGGQTLTKPAKLRIDGEAPLVKLQVKPGLRQVSVRLHDGGSGLMTKKTNVSFGAGMTFSGGSKFHVTYPRSGHYRVTVRAGDKAGNRVFRHFEVRVG